jgi:diguanylate cyclase (GGDEF)-like protein
MTPMSDAQHKATEAAPDTGVPPRDKRRTGAVVQELLGVVVPVVLVVQMVLLLVLELRAASIENTRSLERINQLADARARLLGEPLWRLQYDKVRASLEEIALDPNVGSVFVEDDTRTAVAQVRSERRASGEEIVRDLSYANGNMTDKAGRLVIRFASAPIIDRLANHYVSGFVVAALAALLLSILTRTTADALIGRPLGQIMAAVQSARETGGRRPVHLKTDNEIGALAAAFNELQDAQARAQAQLEHHALHDELTGLPNRRFLHQRLAALGQGEPRLLALHFVDLDDFKGINDTFGHEAGDRYLAHVARRLQAAAGTHDWVARLGGDEFVVLQDGVADEAAAQAFASHLLKAIAAPVEINGKQIVPKGSIGAAVRRSDDPDVGSLLLLADIALYDVKQHRAGCFGLLTPPLLRAHRWRKELAQALPTAFEAGQFEAWFQGQFDLRTGALAGLEALVRWRHPEHGLIPPTEFVPIIEQSGASTTLARLVFERLCEARLVLAQHGLPGVPIAMNVSPHELADFSFGEEMVEIAKRYDVPLAGFEIEITEGLLINNVANTNEALARIRASGVRVALDDFGQGYSSLAYLRRFSLDRLKIDKAFTRELAGDVGGAAVLEVIVGLARKLDLDVVVEGIEQESQAEALRALGVRVGQGFLYHRPQPLDDLVAFIRRNGIGPAPLRAAC